MLAQACTHAHQARASRRNARRTCTLLGTLRVPLCSAFFLATITFALAAVLCQAGLPGPQYAVLLALAWCASVLPYVHLLDGTHGCGAYPYPLP